jgi:hypothetical protein
MHRQNYIPQLLKYLKILHSAHSAQTVHLRVI